MERLDKFIRYTSLNDRTLTSYCEIFDEVILWASDSESYYTEIQVKTSLNRYGINSFIVYNLKKVKISIVDIVPLFIENKLKDLHKVVELLVKCIINLDGTPEKYKIFAQQIQNTYIYNDEILEGLIIDDREEIEGYISFMGG